MTANTGTVSSVRDFVDALLCEEHPRLVFAALRLRLETDDELLDEHDVSNLLEELESSIPVEEAFATLSRVGLLSTETPGSRTLTIGRTPFEVEEVHAMFGSGSLPHLVPAEVSNVLRRAGAWSSVIASRCRALGTAGVPAFWSLPADASEFEPLVNDVGSVATADLLALWALVNQGSSVTLSDDLAKIADVLLCAIDPTGAVVLDTFDDDFVYTFSAGRGSHPTLDAAANACSALSALAKCRCDPTLQRKLAVGVDRLAAFTCAAQNPNGSWSIHRDPNDVVNYPARQMSIRFAVLGLADAIESDLLTRTTGEAASRALDLAADFLGTTLNGAAGGWSDSFHPDRTDSLKPTTALLLEPATRLHRLPAQDIDRISDTVTRWFEADRPDVLRIQFRVPTYTGPSSDVLSWELPANGIGLAGLSAAPLTAERRLIADQLAVEIVNSGRSGYWYDLMMAKAGAQRAFVSNTLLQARALMSWRLRTIAELTL